MSCKYKYLVPQSIQAYSLENGIHFKYDFLERLTLRADSHFGHLFIIGGLKDSPQYNIIFYI